MGVDGCGRVIPGDVGNGVVWREDVAKALLAETFSHLNHLERLVRKHRLTRVTHNLES